MKELQHQYILNLAKTSCNLDIKFFLYDYVVLKARLILPLKCVEDRGFATHKFLVTSEKCTENSWKKLSILKIIQAKKN